MSAIAITSKYNYTILPVTYQIHRFLIAFPPRNNDDIASFPSNPRVTVADGWLNVTQLEQGDRGRYTCRVVDALAPLTSFILVVTGKRAVVNRFEHTFIIRVVHYAF